MLRGDYPKGISIFSNLVQGESEIFNLINYDMLDGVIVFGTTIYRKDTIFNIVRNCKEHNIPVINVNDLENKFENNVFIQNNYAMELIVEHLVVTHKLTKINFIGGYPDNKETIERLNAYKKILTEHNIPIEEKRIAYGHFWKYSVECVKEFLKNDEPPQAIVCANDTMAICVCDYLKQEGYSVPEDIIVTGFDGTADADLYKPALTTVRPDYEIAGADAYELLEDLMNGNTMAEDVLVQSELIVQESCGCRRPNNTKPDFIDTRYHEVAEFNAFNKILIKTDAFFADSDSTEEFYEHIFSGVSFFGFKRFYMCINSELEINEDRYENYRLASRKKNYGISEKMVSVKPYRSDIHFMTTFDSKQLLPDEFLTGDSPVIMAFSPLYYKDMFIGYTGYEPRCIEGNGEIYLIWSLNASELIGSYYVKKELEELNLRDYFTGLYNRRGMNKYFQQIYDKYICNNRTEKISIVCADIDCLKQINDNYGHEAGDNAILQAAKAIKTAFGNENICVRTGGDEFCILMHSTDEIDVELYVEKVDEYLRNYNKNSSLDYKISCSCGYFSMTADKFSSFEEMRCLADNKLYEIKQKHHEKITEVSKNN